jgi:hypothetical protein
MSQSYQTNITGGKCHSKVSKHSQRNQNQYLNKSVKGEKKIKPTPSFPVESKNKNPVKNHHDGQNEGMRHHFIPT